MVSSSHSQRNEREYPTATNGAVTRSSLPVCCVVEDRHSASWTPTAWLCSESPVGLLFGVDRFSNNKEKRETSNLVIYLQPSCEDIGESRVD